MMKRLRIFLAVLVLILPELVYSQVYRGVKEVAHVSERLARLDMYLQVEPSKCLKEIEDLQQLADKEKNESLKTLLQIYLGTYYYYTGKNDEAVVCFDKAIQQADRIKNPQLHSSASIRKLFVIDRLSDPEIMLQFMEDEYLKAKKRKDTLNMIYSLNGMAMYNERLDQNKESIQQYMDAIKLAKNNQNLFEYGFLLNNFGLLKLRMKSPKDAYKDFQEGIAIAKRLENIRLELTLRENLGYYYMEVDSLELAEREYQYTLELAKSRKYVHLEFHSLVNLAVLERTRGNEKLSDSLFANALNRARTTHMYYAMSPIFLNLAQIELNRANYSKMDRYLDSAKYYSKYTSNNEVHEMYLLTKYKEHKKRNRFEEALQYYQELTDFRDSLDRGGHAIIMNELQLKYNVERTEKERISEKNKYESKLAQREIDNANLKRNIAIILIILAILISGFLIYYFYRQQRREIEFSNALVNKLEEERGRIARDLHDGLGQSLVILKNKFNQLGDAKTDDRRLYELNEEFAKVIEDVRSISRSLIPPELRRLGLKKSIEKMMKDVHFATGLMTTLELDALDRCKLSEPYEIRIYRIIQELTTNTVKHASATSMKIEFGCEGKVLSIVYQDNGKGFDPDKISQGDSLGLRSIEQRIRFMKGILRYEKQSKGMKVVIRLKLKEDYESIVS